MLKILVLKILVLKILVDLVDVPQRLESCNFDNYHSNSRSYIIQKLKKIDASTGFTLLGSIGVGKTHLAIATINNFPRVKLASKISIDIGIEYRKGKCLFLSVPFHECVPKKCMPSHVDHKILCSMLQIKFQ